MRKGFNFRIEAPFICVSDRRRLVHPTLQSLNWTPTDPPIIRNWLSSQVVAKPIKAESFAAIDIQQMDHFFRIIMKKIIV